MDISLTPHLVADLGLGFILGALSPRPVVTCIGCLIIPFITAIIGIGVENVFSAATEGSGLVHMIYVHFVMLGLVLAALGGLLGHGFRYCLRLLVGGREKQ